MSRTAYVDESARGKSMFLLAVVIVPASFAGELDRLTRQLFLPGQQRLHLNNEKDSRRRQIIDTIASTPIRAWIYTVPEVTTQSREACLRRAVVDIVGSGIKRLVLDRIDDQQRQRDLATIYESSRKLDALLSYEHAESRKFAGLQAADVVAWAFSAGGDWRRRIQPLIDEVTAV